MLTAVSRGATGALGLMVSVVVLLVLVGRGVVKKGRGMGVILKTLGEVEIQLAVVRGISTRTNMLLLDRGKPCLPAPTGTKPLPKGHHQIPTSERAPDRAQFIAPLQ